MRRFLTFALLALAVLPPLALHAQPAPLVAQDEADRLFREANKLYNDKRYADAEALYEQAFAKKHAHDIAANLGYAELNQRKFVEAATHLAFAVRTWPPTGKDDKKQYAVERLALAKAEVVTLTIEVSVADAHVLVGDREAGLSPLATEAFADPGRAVVRAKRAGYRDAEQAVEGAKGSALAVKIEMQVEAASVPSATVTASAMATSTAMPEAPRSMVPAYVIGGIGIASVIVGGVLVGVAEGKRGEIRSRSPMDEQRQPLCGQSAPVGAIPNSTCDQLRATAGSASVFGNAGIAMLALGGAALAGATLYWFWPSKPASPSKSASLLVPVVAADGGGLQWTGSF